MKLTPRAGSAGRKPHKGEANASPMDGYAGRAPSKKRGQYPDPTPTPIPKSKPRAKTGSAMENKLVNRQVNGPAVRKGGGSGRPAGSTASPFKASGGNGPGNSTKNPKAN